MEGLGVFGELYWDAYKNKNAPKWSVFASKIEPQRLSLKN
jgi:hypothetical protein